MQQLLQILVAHFAVFLEIFKNCLHLRRNDRCSGLCFCRNFCARRNGVHVRQHDSKCICRCLDAGLGGAACVELENAADAGAVAFNQAQAVKNLCQLFIPRLRNAEADILRGKTGQEAAQRNKFHFAVVHVDDNAAAEAVVPMHQRIEQRFADGFLGIVLLIRADDTLDGRDCPVAQRQIVDQVFKLLEDRAAKLLAVPELGAGFIVEYGDFRCVLALVGQKQRQIGVLIVVNVPKPQRNVLVV